MKILFQFNIQSFTDVITNSSSELFVFNKGSKDEVINLLNLVYPNWRDEYNEPISLGEMDEEELECYFSCIKPFNYHTNETKYSTDQTYLATNFNIDPKILYSNWKIFDPSIKFPRREDYKTVEDWDEAYEKYRNIAHVQLVDNWVDLIKPKLDLNTICLYSISDNPNWDYQEILEGFAQRYHLG